MRCGVALKTSSLGSVTHHPVGKHTGSALLGQSGRLRFIFLIQCETTDIVCKQYYKIKANNIHVCMKTCMKFPGTLSLFHPPTLAICFCNSVEPWGSAEDGRGLSSEAAALDMKVGIFVNGKWWAWHWDGTTKRRGWWGAWKQNKEHRMTKSGENTTATTCIMNAHDLMNHVEQFTM